MSADRQIEEAEIGRALRAAAGPTERDPGARAARRDSELAAQRLAARARERGLLDVAYDTVESPFGTLLAARTPRGLVRLAFPEEPAEEVLGLLARRVSPRVLHAPGELDPLRRELDEYFAGRRRTFRTRADWSVIGPFGTRVLRATSAIPYGSVLTYSRLAGEIGNPRAHRAAGNALAANPIPIVIPCHRVLRTGGGLGGYAGGLPRKRWLLELEGAVGV